MGRDVQSVSRTTRHGEVVQVGLSVGDALAEIDPRFEAAAGPVLPRALGVELAHEGAFVGARIVGEVREAVAGCVNTDEDN